MITAFDVMSGSSARTRRYDSGFRMGEFFVSKHNSNCPQYIQYNTAFFHQGNAAKLIPQPDKV